VYIYYIYYIIFTYFIRISTLSDFYYISTYIKSLNVDMQMKHVKNIYHYHYLSRTIN